MEAASALSDVLLNPVNIALSAAVWAVLKAVDKAVSGTAAGAVWARLLPLMPLLLCVVAYFFLAPVGMSVGEKVVMGVLIGTATAHGDKALKQTAMGRDTRITGS